MFNILKRLIEVCIKLSKCFELSHSFVLQELLIRTLTTSNKHRMTVQSFLVSYPTVWDIGFKQGAQYFKKTHRNM